MNKIIQEDMEFIFSKNHNWEQLRNKTVFITGCYGMLASYMVFMLIFLNECKENYNIKIICIGRNTQKAKDRFGEYFHRDYFCFIESDISSKIEIPEQVDFVIHAASPASSQYYSVNPVGVLLPNILGTYNTLELARQKKVSGYLFFSSGEIYGKIERSEIFEDDSGYLNPIDVRSCYGESKRMGENMCKCYQHQYKIPTKIIRPSHTFGPTMDLLIDNRVFAEFTANVLKGENIVMKSDGSAVRIFIYIADAVAGYFKILFEGTNGEAYNVSNMNGIVSIKELAHIICDCVPEKKLRVICEERKEDYLENTHKMHAVLNTKKLEKLGWQPVFSIEQGFKRTIESFK